MLLLSWRDCAMPLSAHSTALPAPKSVCNNQQQRDAECLDMSSAARYSLRSRGAQAADAHGTPSPGVAAGAAPRALCASLQDMPYEVLMRILSHASAGGGLSAETLFRLGGLCASLRRACGSVEDSALAVPLAASWARAVINLVDPAAALLAEFSERHGRLRSPATCYIAHARLLGGWYQLLHALAERYCASCGDVTRMVAWCGDESEDGHTPFGLRRCCADCTPPEAMDVDTDGDAPDSGENESRGIRRCAVVNVQFWSAEPEFVVNAADWEHPDEKLKELMREAVDGDTIGLRGEFTFDAAFFTTQGKAVRLLGIPVATPHRWMHAAGPDDVPGLRIAQLRRFELDSVAELGGFPSATIHVERNCIWTFDAAWFENIYISSGPRFMGCLLPGEHRYPHNYLIDSIVADGERVGAFSGLCAFNPHDLDETTSWSTVLLRCWLTGYFGTSLIVTPNCSVALLRCVITNSRYHDVLAEPGSALRMRGCRVMCSQVEEHSTRWPGQKAFALSESQHALFTSANDIFRFARPSSLVIGAPHVPERVMTYRASFDPRLARLLT